MESGGLQARIEHGIAHLRAAHPRIDACSPHLDQWREKGRPRYALRLDVRWPQHQGLVSGPARDSAAEAVQAGLAAAQRSFTSHA